MRRTVMLMILSQLWVARPALAESLEGVAVGVVTGKEFDLVSADGVKHRIHLVGIDLGRSVGGDCLGADGASYYCEDHALATLRGLLMRAGWKVRCAVVENRDHDTLGLCESGGKDLGEVLLREGRAMYSERDLVVRGGPTGLPPGWQDVGRRYGAAMQEAFSRRIGLWNVVGPAGESSGRMVSGNNYGR